MSVESLLHHVAQRIESDTRFELALRGRVEDALALWDEHLTMAQAKELGLLMPPTHDWAGVRAGYEWSGTGDDYRLYTADESGLALSAGGDTAFATGPIYAANFGPVDTPRRDNRGGAIVPWLLGTGPAIWAAVDGIGNGGGGGAHQVGGGGAVNVDSPDDAQPVPVPSAAMLAAPLLFIVVLRRGARSARA